MRILFINHYAGSDVHGMEYRPFYLAKEWQKAGCETTIVAASYSHLRTLPPNVRGSLTQEVVNGIRYIWLWTPWYEGNGLGRALNMLAFTCQLIRRSRFLVKRCRPDAVLSSSTYPLANIPAFAIARLSRAKLVCEVRDLWPLTLVQLKGMSRWHPFILAMQWAENFSYRHADYATSTLPNAAAHMVPHGLKPKQFVYIPNGVSLEAWHTNGDRLPEEHRNALARLKAENRFVCAYAGSHGISNSLGTFLDAAALLQRQPVVFVFIGQGPEKPLLQERARREQLNNVLFLPPVQRACVPALFGEVDAFFLGWQRKPMYRFGLSPNKLLDYMMAGKPIIHAIDSGNDSVAQSRCGISVDPEAPQQIAAAVCTLLALPPADREAMGQRARSYVQANHDYVGLARRYLEVLR